MFLVFYTIFAFVLYEKKYCAGELEIHWTFLNHWVKDGKKNLNSLNSSLLKSEDVLNKDKFSFFVFNFYTNAHLYEKVFSLVKQTKEVLSLFY